MFIGILDFVGKNIVSILSLLLSAFALYKSNNSHVREKEIDYLSELQYKITTLMNQNSLNSNYLLKFYIQLNSHLQLIVMFMRSSLSNAGNGNITLPNHIKQALKDTLETLESFSTKSIFLKRNPLSRQVESLKQKVTALLQSKTVTHSELGDLISEANNLLTEFNNCVAKESEDNKLTIENLQKEIDIKKKQYKINELYDKSLK